jgi:hypothetical protein
MSACSSLHFPHNQRVRLKRITAFILVCCSAISFVAILARSPARQDEPMYQGKTLSEWLNVYTFAGSDRVPWDQHAYASNAIRAIGTNAVTNLLAWIRFEPAGWQRRLEARIKPDSPTRFLEPITYNNRRMWRAVSAQRGFEILGSIASPAIPELVVIINDTNSQFSGPLALRSLVHLGAEAIIPLIQVLTNANHPQHRRAPWAVYSMNYLGEVASPLIPILVPLQSKCPFPERAPRYFPDRKST